MTFEGINGEAIYRTEKNTVIAVCDFFMSSSRANRTLCKVSACSSSNQTKSNTTTAIACYS